MAKAPQIGLLHATPISTAQVQDAFASTWPQAEIVNLLAREAAVTRMRELLPTRG